MPDALLQPAIAPAAPALLKIGSSLGNGQEHPPLLRRFRGLEGLATRRPVPIPTQPRAPLNGTVNVLKACTAGELER